MALRVFHGPETCFFSSTIEKPRTWWNERQGDFAREYSTPGNDVQLQPVLSFTVSFDVEQKVSLLMSMNVLRSYLVNAKSFVLKSCGRQCICFAATDRNGSETRMFSLHWIKLQFRFHWGQDHRNNISTTYIYVYNAQGPRQDALKNCGRSPSSNFHL